MSSLRRLAFAVCAAPLALGLAACGDEAAEGPPRGEPIAEIAPPAGQSWVETAVVTRLLAGGPDGSGPDGLPGAVAEGTAVVTLAAPPRTPYALDADVATHVLHLEGGVLRSARLAANCCCTSRSATRRGRCTAKAPRTPWA